MQAKKITPPKWASADREFDVSDMFNTADEVDTNEGWTEYEATACLFENGLVDIGSIDPSDIAYTDTFDLRGVIVTEHAHSKTHTGTPVTQFWDRERMLKVFGIERVSQIEEWAFAEALEEAA